jgi:hypothetical protein
MSTFLSVELGIDEVIPFVNALNAPTKSLAAPDHD